MSNALVASGASAVSDRMMDAAAKSQFVTMYIKDQMLGIPVKHVQDVLKPQRITPVPLAPVEVVGSLNLCGREL